MNPLRHPQPEAELEGAEGHLPTCSECRDRLEVTEEYIVAMRNAAARIGGAGQASSYCSLAHRREAQYLKAMSRYWVQSFAIPACASRSCILPFLTDTVR